MGWTWAGWTAGGRLGRLLILMIASSAIAAAPAGASALQINDLGLANAQNVAGFYWTAVNDSDQVSGSEPAGPNKFQAARWSNGTASLLGTLGPYSSGGSGITNAGTVLGYRGDDLGSGLGIYPTLWDLAGNQQELPAYPGGENGGFLAVAKNGTAVLTDDSAPVNNNHAVIAQPPYTTVVKTPGFNPTSVNTSAHAVGTSDGGVHEYWNGSAAVPVQVAVNSGFITSTHALNDADQVIGNTTAGLAAVQQEPSGALTTLPEVPGAPAGDFKPQAINDGGVVVGNAASGAAIWTPGKTTQLLDSLLPPGSGWHLLTAVDINVRGDVLGTGTVNGQTHWYLLSVPGTKVSGTVFGVTCSGSTCGRARLRGQTIVVTGTASDGSAVTEHDATAADGSWSVIVPPGRYSVGPSGDGVKIDGRGFDPLKYAGLSVGSTPITGRDFTTCTVSNPAGGAGDPSPAAADSARTSGAAAAVGPSACKSTYTVTVSAKIPQAHLVDPSGKAPFEIGFHGYNPSSRDRLFHITRGYPECLSPAAVEHFSHDGAKAEWYTYIVGGKLGSVKVSYVWDRKAGTVHVVTDPEETHAILTRKFVYRIVDQGHVIQKSCSEPAPVEPLVLPAGGSDLSGSKASISDREFSLIVAWEFPFEPTGVRVDHTTLYERGKHVLLSAIEAYDHAIEALVAHIPGIRNAPRLVRAGLEFGASFGLGTKFVNTVKAAPEVLGGKFLPEVIAAVEESGHLAHQLHNANSLREAIGILSGFTAESGYPVMGAIIRGRFQVSGYQQTGAVDPQTGTAAKIPLGGTLGISVASTKFPTISLKVVPLGAAQPRSEQRGHHWVSALDVPVHPPTRRP